MENNLTHSQDYKTWLTDLKTKVRQIQLKAAIAVNHELLCFYWELGSEIVEKQKATAWGEGFLKQLSRDLMIEFPEIKGFSKRNLELIRQWYVFWQGQPIAKQPVSQSAQIPWGHNIAIIAKCKNPDEAFYYVQNTICVFRPK